MKPEYYFVKENIFRFFLTLPIFIRLSAISFLRFPLKVNKRISMEIMIFLIIHMNILTSFTSSKSITNIIDQENTSFLEKSKQKKHLNLSNKEKKISFTNQFVFIYLLLFTQECLFSSAELLSMRILPSLRNTYKGALQNQQ